MSRHRDVLYYRVMALRIVPLATRNCLTVLLILAAGCGGGPRAAVMRAVEEGSVPNALQEYERYRQDDGGDGDLLAHVAALVLEEAARSEDEAQQRAALSQLTLAGTAGYPILERLGAGDSPLPVRARALQVLARRGDGDAQAALRGFLDEDDPEVLSAAVEALDGGDDEAQLIVYLEHTGASVRQAAAGRLVGAAPSGAARAALAEAARVDPEPRVRARAVRSLGAYGQAAFEYIRERLSDPDASVRLGAVSALVEADRSRALAAVGSLLEIAPSRAGIEAARLLAMESGEEGEEPSEGAVLARAFLRRALASGDASVRSQAAVALTSLRPSDDLTADLVAQMEEDSEASVRVALATLLLNQSAAEDKARETLQAVAEGEGMPAVQAAAALARNGDADAVPLLLEAMREGPPSERRVAARAVARDALRPDEARTALRDEDEIVRIHAAGGILAASVAG
ncbi:MAG: HEAT repeat domain-containing protein [Myxococcota bacterium]